MLWYFPISKKNNNYFFNKRNNIMDILNKVAELRAELKEQIATLIRQIYVETYGDFPDFEDRESYYLDFYDIPVEMNRMKICTLSIDIYQYIDESNSCEKQKVEYIIFDIDGKIDFETHLNTIPFENAKFDDIVGIYEFLKNINEELK